MATLANRDWYIANTNGQPLKVRCLSQNYVLGTARVVTEQGEFGEVNADALKREPEEITALNLSDETKYRCNGTLRWVSFGDWIPCPGCQDCKSPK